MDIRGGIAKEDPQIRRLLAILDRQDEMLIDEIDKDSLKMIKRILNEIVVCEENGFVNKGNKLCADSYKAIGNDLFGRKKYADASEFYTLAIQNDHKNPIYHTNRAAAFIEMNIHSFGLSDSTHSLEVDPSNSKTKLRLAKCMLECGRIVDSFYELYQLFSLDNSMVIYDELISVYQKISNATVDKYLVKCFSKNLTNMDTETICTDFYTAKKGIFQLGDFLSDHSIRELFSKCLILQRNNK